MPSLLPCVQIVAAFAYAGPITEPQQISTLDEYRIVQCEVNQQGILEYSTVRQYHDGRLFGVRS